MRFSQGIQKEILESGKKQKFDGDMIDTGCHPLGFTPPKESEWNSPSPGASSRNSSPKIRDLDWANSNLY